MTMDFSYYYIEEVKDVNNLQFDVFISAFDGCERTSITYNRIKAGEKHWIVFPQYDQKKECLPDCYCTSDKLLESDFVAEVLDTIDLKNKSICVDSTGFLIPHLVFLIQFFKRAGINKYDIIYSEPASYKHGEETEFTRSVNEPRPIEGYSSSAKNVNGNDALIVFSGFNDSLVTSVARNKSKSLYKYLFTGFPSLQADMYQQNLIQLSKSKESIGETHVTNLKAPAYDPFVAAKKLQEVVNELMKDCYNIEYIHVSPLSTKPMAIAAALVYLTNPNSPIDIIYPPSDTYVSGHAIGIKRTWRYTIEL